ncbi:MAG: HNH endonuclease signature motif containing protein [Candidatus Electrothrix aestuarii]|uniref:HNH endonuclease signature motif containing protein n=1 Tax=Candidatus Electrothrix aestuarii TaxID=3062594 RepID=A0AAU8LWG0_9BACT|nr:HNH endonuclease signature motif containing protein [Candidatus Electrothrix aestuarii]
MSIKLTTIKRLFAASSNQCAFPKCTAPIIVDGIVVGEMCHIKARRKNGPRYDATLSAADKDGYDNLLLLCETCHKLIDANPERYSSEVLTKLKHQHEESGICEITPQQAHDAQLLLQAFTKQSRTSAKATGQGVAIAINGDVKAPITVNQAASRKPPTSKYPKNAIGADANMAGYVDYLFGLGIDYWKNTPNMTAGRLGKKIKTKFRLKTRTRNHISVERFQELVNFIINDILKPSPVGKRHLREGTKLCRTFSEWRYGSM